LATDDTARESKKDRLAKKAVNAERARLQEAIEKIYEPKKPPHDAMVTERENLYDFARAQMGDPALTYLEFGVRQGRSMKRMMTRFGHPDALFYGFDSFVGLPEQWRKMQPGTFSTEGQLPELDDPRARFVKGWFQNSVPGFLAEHDLRKANPLLVHFDADLYSSTLFLLTSLWHQTDEYYFIFDEFLRDEVVAMYDFARSYPIEYEFFAQTTTSAYTQIFGRMRRVEFEPAA
jgi:O-methyltransferase